MYRDYFDIISQFVFFFSFFACSPPEIGTMRKLRWLYLNDNNLSSTIPLELEDVTRLAYLWLNDNKISGSINPGLFANKGFKYLQELLLHNNLITGTVSRPTLSLSKSSFRRLRVSHILFTMFICPPDSQGDWINAPRALPFLVQKQTNRHHSFNAGFVDRLGNSETPPDRFNGICASGGLSPGTKRYIEDHHNRL